MSALSISNLKKTYAGGFVALNGVDLEVAEGDFFALLGKNGAGKSTIIGIITSLINKNAGAVKIFDADIDRDFALAKSYIGVVPQEFNFSIFETPLQIVCNQAGYYGVSRKVAMERAEEFLSRLHLWDVHDKMAQTLSGGMKRRLMIARALMHKPRLLILDEPTAGVDVQIRRTVWDFLSDINDAGTTIILTTHYLEEAESLCRNVAILVGGEVVESTGTNQLLAKLQLETYVLDLAEAMQQLPADHPRNWRLKNSNSLEVDIPKGGNLNEVFEQLGRLKIKVRSMRNKTNRLERLFLDMTNESTA